jgi:acyl-CoA synthetase (AMP-forming)/AMP-acid ligase II
VLAIGPGSCGWSSQGRSTCAAELVVCVIAGLTLWAIDVQARRVLLRGVPSAGLERFARRTRQAQRIAQPARGVRVRKTATGFKMLDCPRAEARSLGQRCTPPTLYAPNCWEWIVSYYAIARVGAVINPINVMLTSEEVCYVVEDCGATALLATADKGLPLLKSRPPGLREIVLFGDDVAAGARSFNTLLQAARVNERPNGESDSDQAIVRQPEDLSTIC